jgi:elongation factor P
MADVVNTNQFKNGMAIEVEGDTYTIVESQHVKPGKGGAFVRTKLKSIASGAVIDRTFRAGEKFTRVDTRTSKMTYLYATEDEVVVMDPDSFEQISLQPSMAEEALKWVVENMDVNLLYVGGTPFAVEAPTSVELEVVRAEPGMRGDTAQGGSKPVTLQTGITIQAPLFIEQGERIKVDTRTGQYLSRA